MREYREVVSAPVINSSVLILRGGLRHWVSKGALDVDGSRQVDRTIGRSWLGAIDCRPLRLDTALLSSLERMGQEECGESDQCARSLRVNKAGPVSFMASAFITSVK